MSFQISVEPSGLHFLADETETLLAAGIRQGIGLPYGCKDGACGSCKCKKISGDVTHGNHQEKALSAEEAANGFVEGHNVECPFHQAQFNLRDGSVACGPATEPAKTWPVKIEGGRVYLDLAH